MFVTTGSLTVYTQYLKKVVLAACLALTLVTGVGVTARPVGAFPIGLDTGSVGCAMIQANFDDLRAQYSKVGRANGYDPQLGVILEQIRQAARDWQALGCYGSILGARASVGQFGDVVLASGNMQSIALPSSQKTGIPQSEPHASGNTQAIALP